MSCLQRFLPLCPSDALIVLKDNTIVSGLDVLVKLCDRHRIPLMASDLDSPDRGAAFGYGVYEIDFGIEGANKALQILIKGIHPGTIPSYSRFRLYPAGKFRGCQKTRNQPPMIFSVLEQALIALPLIIRGLFNYFLAEAA